jgi:outer membrane immunogenic protein
MLRRILLASAFAFGGFASAMAADLDVVEAPRAAPAGVFDWTGLYAGIHGGIASYNNKGQVGNDALPPDPSSDYSFSAIAPIVGAHAGVNVQSGMFVGGIEADVDGVFLDKKHRFVNAGYLSSNGHDYDQGLKASWQASLRARAGIASGRTLFYGTGGVAVGGFESQSIHYNPNNSLAELRNPYSKTRTGYTVGLGLEHAYTNNFTVKLEYRYTDFGKVTNVTSGGACGTIQMCGSDINAKIDSHSFLVGFSYKLGAEAPKPVTARF